MSTHVFQNILEKLRVKQANTMRDSDEVLTNSQAKNINKIS